MAILEITMNLPILNFADPENPGPEYIYSRDPLDLMRFSFYKTFAYTPTEEQVAWLEGHLHRYCERYVPARGFRALFGRPSKKARRLYDLFRSANTFGGLYTLIVGNLSPVAALELLGSDVVLKYLNDSSEHNFTVQAAIGAMGDTSDEEELHKLMEPDEVVKLGELIVTLNGGPEGSELRARLVAYSTAILGLLK